jgi:deazaflavin-dependent oxidoreductase (nitroreductase family)
MATSSSRPAGTGRSTRRAMAAEVAGREKAEAAPETEVVRVRTPRAARAVAAKAAVSTAKPEADWGQGLPAYPESVQSYLPWLHAGFNALNKYVSVPSLKAGLGRYMSNPATGYLMVLRTRGRKSGEMRDAPLGYVIDGDAVYVMAGFGQRTHWFQNIKADPKVEAILPSRSFSGIAEEVTDPAERRRMLVKLIRSMGLVAASLGMGNAYKTSAEELEAKCEGLPLVKVRATGIAAGPEDPGGWYWTVPIVASALLALLWLRGRRRSKRACKTCR